jgi:hypothetical protein
MPVHAKAFLLRELCEQLKLVWEDGGYRGDDLLQYVKKLWN